MKFDRGVVAQRLKQAMNEQNWHATALCRAAGIHEHAIYHFLRGRSNNIEKLEIIAKTLNRPLSYFLAENPVAEDSAKTKESLRSARDNDVNVILPYNGALFRESLLVVETILDKKGIEPSKGLVDRLTDIVYKHAIENDRNNISEDFALGVVEAMH